MVHSKSNSKQIKLYDYQQTAFEKLVVALKTTFRALLVMATGLGKTILSIEVVKYFITPKDKVLFLCHDNGILNKAYKDYKKLIGDQYTYAKFYGDEKDWEADKHHFVFATFQSVLAHLQNKDAKKKLFSPKHFSFIVVDESHHAQAETFAEVINYFKPKYKLGMTATPDREDQADIRDIFGQEVADIRLPEAIAKNWLTKIDYKVLSDGLDEDKIREVCKEVLEDNVRLTEKQINEKIFIKVRTAEQCKIVQKYSKKQKAIVFCENIEHLRHVASILPSSVAIHSEQSNKVNDSNFSLFEHGHVQHVVVVDKFNEGIDIPDTELIVFLRATNSERIFLQQLGRGLRKVKGKEKVTVLDFVANIDRIKQVAKLTKEIKHFGGAQAQEKENHAPDTPLHVEGDGFRFDFSNRVVDLLSVFEKLEQDFYPTWEEAAVAVQKLGFKNQRDYLKNYRLDPKLPSSPYSAYKNFPGFEIFLYGQIKEFYETLEQAAVSIRKLGIRTPDEYELKRNLDPKLPASLYATYDGFKGFRYLWFYLSYDEASNAAQKLGIKNIRQYKLRYKEDPRLPSSPDQIYNEFISWESFLSSKKYSNWNDAFEAIKSLGIKNGSEYKDRYTEDKKLPSRLDVYEDFPGWKHLPDYTPGRTGKFVRDYYSTWQEASNACIKLNILSSSDYWSGKYKLDSRLPSSPHVVYKDFPGWLKFLGKE